MKKSNVKVGETYRCKVSGELTDVRITGENPHGGWDAVNVETNRKVRIKSPQRLRGRSAAAGKKMKVMSKAEYEAGAKPEPTSASERARASIAGRVAKGRKKATKGRQDREETPHGQT